MSNKTDIFADDFDGQAELIRRLREDTGVLESERIIEAFQKIDRKDFVRDDYQVEAYEDYPLPIGHDQTISQPTTVAFMLELLDTKEGEKILDVGCGSGWTTALLAAIVGDSGQVIGLEVVEELVDFGRKNLDKYDFAHAKIRHSDGGAPQLNEAPFDKMLVSAAAEEIPDGFIRQLKDNGIIVIPIGNNIVKATKVPKGDGYQLETEEHPGFRFVEFQS